MKTRLSALLAALLLAGPVLADARADAKRHFREGMSLIAAGQLERGIAELKQAYAIKPHPDVLYDIAKAYVDLGNIPDAISYFRQYLATDPEDKEQVQSVVARLQTAISAAAAQPAPAAPAAPAAGQPAGDVQKLLAQLQALIAQQQGQPAPAGAKPASTAPFIATPPSAEKPPAEEDMFEAETISAKSKATAKEIAAELGGSAKAQEASGEDIFEEQVVTASARSSSEAKTPASLTIISEDEIRMSGAATIPEILRRVPGIDVAEMNPSDTNISIRGFNRRVANKVLVLVDGRSVYQDFLGTTLWPLLDVAVQDISRIEVIRGPGSALYGASAFAGVVNIITKIGDEASGARAFMQAGDHSTFQGGVSAGGRTGKLAYRTTVAYDRADKWTKDVADGRVDLASQFSQPNRSREVQRADMAATYDLGKVQVRAGGGFDNMAIEVVPLGALRTFGNTGQSGFARLEVDSGQTKVKAFWNALRMSSGPEYWPTGITSLLAAVRSDVIDVSAQTGFDFKGLGQHHLNVGAGYRYKGVTWGYLAPHGGTPYQENHFNAFLQEEWDPTKKLSIILSYRIDRDPVLYANDVTAGGLVQSPRGTILYELKPDQVLRFTVGSAFREPTFLESYIDLFAPIPNQPALGVRFQGSGKLRPEEMLQAELGFRGRIGSFQPDIVVYAERVHNLITDARLTLPANPAQAVDPATGQYIIGYTGFENEPGNFFGVGTEVGGKWTPADGVDLGLNYSFEKMFACSAYGAGSGCTDDISTPNQVAATVGNTAQHKLNVTALWRTKSNFDLGMDLHFVSSVAWTEGSFDISRPGGVLYTAFPIPAYTLVNGRVGYRWIKDKLETGVAVYNLLGDDHREHPFGNQIGRRVLFTASGSF
ncbi:MAG: TonB-dependent receptor domain-containing protein [Myxococcales bacterium]